VLEYLYKKEFIDACEKEISKFVEKGVFKEVL